MLSNSNKYAIKALLYLALNSNSKKKLKAHEISFNTKVPLPYLSKLLQKLAKADKISSERGPNGGFYLNEENKNQNLNDIIEVLNTQDALDNCVLGFEKCNKRNKCLLHDIFFDAKKTLMNNLKSKTIKDLLKES